MNVPRPALRPRLSTTFERLRSGHAPSQYGAVGRRRPAGVGCTTDKTRCKLRTVDDQSCVICVISNLQCITEYVVTVLVKLHGDRPSTITPFISGV